MAESDPSAAAAEAMTSAPPPIVVGVDLGALFTKITLGLTHDHELVRNAHGGHATPTAVTFPSKSRARLLGEDAAEAGRADGNTVAMLDRLLVDSLKNGWEGGPEDDEEDALAKFRRFELRTSDARDPKVYVPNMEEEYSTTALMAMLLGNVRGNVAATIARLEGDLSADKKTNSNNLRFVFAVPASYPQSARDALTDAAYGASVSGSSVVDSARCLAAVYERKFADAGEEKEKVVLAVEVGHARSSVSVLRKTPRETDEKKEDGAAGDAGGVEVLSTVGSPTLGAGLVDVALYDHFLSAHPSLSHHAELKENSRTAQRLLEGCRKLKHLLSMLPENKVTVENIGKNDTDVNLSCTRETLKQLCEKTVIARLKGMIDTAMKKAGGIEAATIGAVEITGGGTRIPFVQEAVRDAVGKGEDFALSRSLDDTSLAFGASLIGVDDAADVEMMDAERQAGREKLLESELAMSRRDVELRRKDEIRNRIEAHVLELRSARHSKHGSLLPSSDEFASYLDSVDDWLFSEECDDADCAQMEEKWNAVESKTEEMCEEYLAAKRAEAEQMDREMEEASKLAAAEKAANGDDDEEDHDTRRLPTKRRMEIVMKNKNEANELFSGKNYRHAAARYAKALTHCSKLFDLSPDEEKEVKEVKLSLHLNLALAYIKLEKLDNARNSCDEALRLDAANVKALYRRATVSYQKRKFDDATEDLKEAERLAPEDKAVKKLRKLVDGQIAKQKKKEKAMAKKMFG
mmetsp:Transcript_28544/g.60504  ORF Transcript_28544/g.60504 Transcript_28544/m.60504 type:complete len:748 (+) Transcript_28544:113-2356(+)